MSAYIDVIVPRGGKGLVAKVQKFSNVHVIGHLEGLCHIYVDKTANIKNDKKTLPKALIFDLKFNTSLVEIINEANIQN